MPVALDITNEKFGKLTAIKKVASKNGKTVWLCKCECGQEKEILTTHLKAGKIKSCGCWKTLRPKEENCLYCNKKLKTHQYKYCSSQHQIDYQHQQYIIRWKEGLEDGLRGDYSISVHIKRYLFEKYQFKCGTCGWNEKNNFTNNVPLEVEHIDGNYKNNKEENLILLCPNCHSLTSTYKGANKGNGRKERRKYN